MTYHTGDTEPPLSGVAGVDLTSAQAHVAYVHRPTGEVISHDATLTDPTTGAWSMAWEPGELDALGVYESKLEVTWSPDHVQAFDGPTFRVEPNLDDSGPPYVPASEPIIDGGLL